MTRPRPWLLILLAALAYAFGHFTWYAPTPLGRVPVLDEAENLTLANQIADGTLPPEPFYRAMGYPLMLATLRWLGVAAYQLPLAALLLGVALHATVALLIGAIARRWFDDIRAGLVAGLLAAFNPVFVHYATQRLDAALGTMLFLAGLLALRLENKKNAPQDLWRATICWTLAALVRPQFLTVLIALPVLGWWRDASPRRLKTIAASFALVMGPFTAQGLWQLRICGEFRLLPWQGAYNLWAANQPGAHGRYYSQTLELPPANPPENPAKLESLLLYQRETGRVVVTTAGIDAMNAHWRTRFLDFVLHHPLAWLGQMARKTYAFLNNWEQYNNKTYAFHQARSPWLAWNPLGWGALLILAPAGFWLLRTHNRQTARAAGVVAVAAAAGILLFFVSARFRLPVAALLCVPAGAALARPTWFFRALALDQGAILVGLMLTAGALAFSQFDHVRDRRPFIQDHLLIARAAQTVGDDAEVWGHATTALALDPARHDANAFLVTSGFNRQLTGDLAPGELAAWRAAAARELTQPIGSDAGPHVLAAAVTRDVKALRELSAATDPTTSIDAIATLVLLDAASAEQRARLQSAPPTAGGALAMMARQAINAEEFQRWAGTHEAPGWSKALASARARLFSAPPTSP